MTTMLPSLASRRLWILAGLSAWLSSQVIRAGTPDAGVPINGQPAGQFGFYAADSWIDPVHGNAYLLDGDG